MRTICCLVATVSFAASAARADDWPQWFGPKRDNVWRETGLIESFPAGGPPLRWKAPIGPGYSGPAVANGRVFVTDRILAPDAKNHAEPFPQRPKGSIAGTERVLCLNEADGTQLWAHEYDCPYTVSYPAGPRATPLVTASHVYTLGTEGHLRCLAVADGTLAWAKDLKAEYKIKAPIWGFSAHPLLDGDKLICMAGGDGSTVVALDARTGKELWKALSSAEPGYYAPSIVEAGGKRQLIVWHGTAVAGLDPETGKTYWSEKVAAYRGMAVATPWHEGPRLFVGAYPDTALMLALAPDAPKATVAWAGGKAKGVNPVFASPLGENGYLYGVTAGGKLCCAKAETGERVWETLDVLGPTPMASAEFFLVRNGPRYVIATERGELIFANLSAKGYEELARTKLVEPTGSAYGRKVLWSHPAFANKSAYWRNDNALFCFSLAAKP